MNSIPKVRISLLACLAAIIAGDLACSPSGRAQQLQEDILSIASTPHRLSGTPEAAAAASYIEGRLRGLDLEVISQSFPVVQTDTKRCDLTFADGKVLPLLPMRPNGILPPVTPPGGVTGPIVHAGKGNIGELGKNRVEGSIVVMDYNTLEGWMTMFRLGAKAVIFIRTTELESWLPHVTQSNANLLRYYYEGPIADLPEGAQVTLQSEIVWKSGEGRNLFAFIPGTDPKFYFDQDEVVILASNYDSFGEVPERSPNATGAANCAALLSLAASLQKNPPRRNTLIAFFDNDARGHAGAGAFYRTLDELNKGNSIESRQASVEKERRNLDQIHDSLRGLRDGKKVGPRYHQLILRLRQGASNETDTIRGEIADLRFKAEALPSGDPQKVAIAEKIGELEKRRNEFNDLRRSLARDQLIKKPPAKLRAVLDAQETLIRSRIAELEFSMKCLAGDRAIRDRISPLWITMQISLLFGDDRPNWGFIVGTSTSIKNPKDVSGLYGRMQSSVKEAVVKAREQGIPLPYFDNRIVNGTVLPDRLLSSTPLVVHSGSIASRYGVYNYAFTTVLDLFKAYGTPDDVSALVNAANVELQVREAADVLRMAGNLESFSVRRAFPTEYRTLVADYIADGRARGPRVFGRSRGSSVPNISIPGAVVQIRTRKPEFTKSGARIDLLFQIRKPAAFDDFYVYRTDLNGSYSYGPVNNADKSGYGFALQFDERGEVIGASDYEGAEQAQSRLNLFRARHGAMVLPPKMIPEQAAVLNGVSNSRLELARSFTATEDGLVTWFVDERVRKIKVFGLRAVVAMGTDTAELASRKPVAETWGSGFDANAVGQGFHSTLLSAQDLYFINETRLRLLRSRGVVNSSIEDLHGRANDQMQSANEAASEAERESHLDAAYLTEIPAYREIRNTLDDLVKAVLVLLLLAVPFAFALERLLVGETNIYRRILWFIAFFAATFLVLYFTHPAFAISKSPMIIFLGFSIVILSVMVIFIIIRKFETEVKAMQGVAFSVHSADVSRFRTIMAAMSMGISTMRRRPLRTALTATTIVLLTFTILCFASFGSVLGIAKRFVNPTPGYFGAFAHRVNWSLLDDGIKPVMQSVAGDNVVTCERRWLSPEAGRFFILTVARADGTMPVKLFGGVGIDARELDYRPDLRDLLGERTTAFEQTIWLPDTIADQLGAREGDPLLINGRTVTLGKRISAASLGTVVEMDGSSFLPVDFEAMKLSEAEMQRADSDSETDTGTAWETLSPNTIAIMPLALIEQLGGTPRGYLFYTKDARRASEVAENLARILQVPVAGTRADGVFNHIFGPVLKASGVEDLIMPLLLGGLVVFGTMLGSVADREKEIYTFSALGLAPPHVASLFFAEALVYSVIGGMGGYLVAQCVLGGLSMLADRGLVTVPEINYSSANAIVTILIVMCTVLVSAIYPALKASRSANPGILRGWKLPEPKGDILDIPFPFTVSDYDIGGVLRFLHEHFDHYRETGLGQFLTKYCYMVRYDNGQYGLVAEVALAPFDLGVTQEFELKSAPSEIPGIDEVRITIRRLSGQPKDWQRLNKTLLDDLRKQFLIWRALPHAVMDRYRQETREEFAQEVVT